MSNARLYALDSKRIANADGKTKTYIAGLKGQAKIVFDAMRDNPKPRLAVEIDKDCTAIVTRQDRFRVTLYYILVFKSKGIVKAYLPDVENEVENAFAGVISEEN